MSFLKQFGDMAQMVKAAPGLIDSANQLADQSAAYRAQMDLQAMQALTAEPLPGNLDPIAGVDLERYARIVKGISAYGYDQSRLVEVAGLFAVDAPSWEAAQVGWAARIQADRGLGRRFNEIYQAV